MARIRTIKPDFFTSEDIVALSPYARLLYIGLWCEADREGRMAWRPNTFKLRYFPGDKVDINALCRELTTRGLVALYGEGLAYIPTFLDHQHINPREAASTLPVPDESSRVTDASARVEDAQVGRKGKEGKDDASLTLPAWVPEDAWKAWLKVRPKVKAPNTPEALSLALRDLEKLRDDGNDPRAVLEAATVKGWRGLFPVKSADSVPRIKVDA
jgi:hypothetical protein